MSTRPNPFFDKLTDNSMYDPCCLLPNCTHWRASVDLPMTDIKPKKNFNAPQFLEYRDTISAPKGNKSYITTPMDIDQDTYTNTIVIVTSSAPEHAMADALPMSTYVGIRLARQKHELARKALRGKIIASKKVSVWA